jgi:hypothetical protein
MDAARMVDATVDVARMAARRSFTLADVPVLDQLVRDLPAGQQLSLARRMLLAPEVHASPIARGPMATIRQAISPLQTEDVRGATLLKQVRDTLDTEIDRIDGLIPSKGYDGHPDYAAIGATMRSLDLLDQLGAFARL